MSISSAIIDPLLNLHGPAAYSVVGALAFGEAAVFLGFVLPGETAVILGGVLAYRHSVSLTLIATVAAVCAIAGDSVGYEVGKRYGTRLLKLKIFAKHQAALDDGQRRLRENGGKAILLARFTAFLRAVMPGMAGTARMPYKTFLPWNATGGIIWGVGFTMLGYSAGASYQKIETWAGRFSEVILALAAVAIIVWVLRRRRKEHAVEQAAET